MVQVLEETLQMWLDGMATLQIDMVGMYDIPAPRAKQTDTTFTLFHLEGENVSLAQLWQLTKQLEALPFVSSWEEVIMQIAPGQYYSLLTVILAVSSDHWSFLKEIEVSEEDN
jgi:hypothetical protein